MLIKLNQRLKEKTISTRVTLVIYRLAEVGERVIYKSLNKRKPPLSFITNLPEITHGPG